MARIVVMIAALWFVALPVHAAMTKPAAFSGLSWAGTATQNTLSRAQAARLHPTVVAPWAAAHARAHRPPDLRGIVQRYLRNVEILSDDSGYIFELTKRGRIVAYLSDCSGAEGLKVDGAGNLWIACTNTGTINMYAPGAAAATLTLQATPKAAAATYFPGDVAVDQSGNVYAANLYAFACSTQCVYLPGNVVYWSASDVENGAVPTGIVNDPNLDGQTDFLDVDASGNVYVDYYGCAPGVVNCGNGLDGIANPQSRQPVVTTLIAPTSGIIGYPGGVYTTQAGTMLNVLDQDSRTILYGLANPAAFVEQGIWGPTPENIQGSCDPVSMGWNKAESRVFIADSECRALLIGTIPHNVFSSRSDIDFHLPVGAGSNPSDK